MQTKTNNGKSVKCIDCGGGVYTAFIRSPKDNNTVTPSCKPVAPSNSIYVILRCKDCDSIFLHPYYFEESFAVYSSERYFAGYFPNNIHTGGGPCVSTPGRDSAGAKRYREKRAQFFLKLADLTGKSGIRVVDIGCAQGNLVQGFADCGCEAMGVDVSEEVISAARRRGLKVYHGRYEDIPFPDSYFDLIVSCQTFEHMAGLKEICTQIRKTLKPNGVLIITVPNDIEGYRQKFFRKIWWMIPPMHIRYFTTKNLKNIFDIYID